MKKYIVGILSYTSLLCAYEQGDDYGTSQDLYIPIDADRPSDTQLTFSKDGRNTGQERKFQGYYPQHIIRNYHEREYDRWFSIHSGYFDSQYNNYDLATFGLELINGMDYVLTEFDDGSRWKNVACASICGYVYYMYQLAYHEIGHGLRGRAHKSNFQLFTAGDLEGSSNFWGYYGKLMLQASFSGSTYTPSLLSNTEEDYNKEQTIISGAGINNEIYLSERIANEIWKGKIYGKTPAIAYLWGRLSPILYALDNSNTPGHDINNILNYYNLRGINVSRLNIQTAYTISAIGGTSLMVLKNLLGRSKYIDIEEQSFHGFRIPDIFPYLTSHGVSYKFVSGYKVSEEFRINVGYERVMHGNTKHEISVGGYFDRGDFAIEANTYFGGAGFSVEAGMSYKLTNRLKINCRVASYATESLIGERQAKELISGLNEAKNGYNRTKRNNLISIGLSYGYGKSL